MSERGVPVDHTTIYRWVQKYAPELDKHTRWYRQVPDWQARSWRVDETYIRVGGTWCYLYRAITAGAIASAKELVETLYKLILDKRGVEYATKDDLPALYKKVATELALRRESVPDSTKGSEAAHKVLNALNTTVFGLAELRNEIGRGHGRPTASPAFHRHARLAFNAAVALAEFLYDTLQDREENHADD